MIASLRFSFSLLNALRHPYSGDEARGLLRNFIAHRSENFLSLCDAAIFEKPKSPYHALLEWAGYSREKLASLVFSQGLEATLTQLASEGVYLEIEEFKGRKPVIRPGLELHVDASQLDMTSGPSLQFQSSGSRGTPLKTRIGLEGLKLLASYIPLMVEFLEAQNLPLILYYPMPSTSGIAHLILFSLAGITPAAWFAQVMMPSWYRKKTGLKLLALATGSRLNHLRLPFPRLADIHHPVALVRWIEKNCSKGAIVATYTSSALHLIQAALSECVELPPLVFILGGEPITKRKREELESRNHRVFPWYSSVETGRIGLACLHPNYSDDMHLLSDRLAAILRPRKVNPSGTERSALLFTSVHPDTYKFLLNVETGDEAVLEVRQCGCPWEILEPGWHIHSIQSFEKLTLEGMSYVSDAFFQLVEDTLPSRCGGTPVDYQFTEEEDSSGFTRLVVSVNPSLPIDEEEVRRTVFESLHASTPELTLMTDILRRASSVVVRRERPRLTRSGKILTLRTNREENQI
jgi:hypothetical protein